MRLKRILSLDDTATRAKLRELYDGLARWRCFIRPATFNEFSGERGESCYEFVSTCCRDMLLQRQFPAARIRSPRELLTASAHE